jgi:CheY-like chemotaxis protein
LREVIEGTLELLANRAQEKGLELIGAINPGTPTALRGDPTRLRQVLLNLVGNAIKFTNAGEVAVSARVQPESDGSLRAFFTVRDTGIGIPPEVQARLFQAFAQADGSTTRKYGGTGLGLAISRQLVELMRGEISVMSESGRGSTFSFSTPLFVGELSAAIPRRASLIGQRVLIVDDNATNRSVLHHQLTSWGMQDAAASGGTEALRLLRAAAATGKAYPLALIDLQMPDMDGIELAHAIKADPAIADTRLVMLTSLGERLDAATRKQIGIDECLLKPLRQARLYDCMARSLGEAPAAAMAVLSQTAILSGPTLRILLAEDNAVNQKVAHGLLRKLGRTADSVRNGREALEAQIKTPYDVILMDCQMPEMEGYEATIRIRQHEATVNDSLTRQVYIIAMTAHALTGEREKCVASGMDDYLSKPVNVASLQAALTRASEQIHDARAPQDRSRTAPQDATS